MRQKSRFSYKQDAEIANFHVKKITVVIEVPKTDSSTHGLIDLSPTKSIWHKQLKVVCEYTGM